MSGLFLRQARSFQMSIIVATIVCSSGFRAGTASGALVVHEFVPGEKVVEDTRAGRYWIWDLNIFTNKTYPEQIATIASLGTYGNITGGWHMATVSEMSSLWSYTGQEIAAAFNPVPPIKTGVGPDYIGRYDYVPPRWAGTHGVAYILLGGRTKSDVPGTARQEDASVRATIGAWVTADGPGKPPVCASQRGIGMVADDSTNSVIVFDPDTDTALVSVKITGGLTIGDCAISLDGTLGFVTAFNSRVQVIDLAASPPALAGGINSIPISNCGEDLTITPDGKFLVVSDGGAVQPISIVDIAARAEIGTFSVASTHNSGQMLSDGSLIVTSNKTCNLYRLNVDGAGIVTNTGDVLPCGGKPTNAFGGLGATSGIAVLSWCKKIRSFTVPGLALVHTRSLSGFGICGLVNPAGNRAYVLSNAKAGQVEVFEFNSTNGELGPAPLLTIPVAHQSTCYGMDQMAISADGAKLYVSEPGALNVYDAVTGAFLRSITHAKIVDPTGVCISYAHEQPRERTLYATDIGTESATLWKEILEDSEIQGEGYRFHYWGSTSEFISVTPWLTMPDPMSYPVELGHDVFGLKPGTRYYYYFQFEVDTLPNDWDLEVCTFTTLSSPVEVFSPNGGECIRAGGIYDLRWGADRSISHVTLEYSLDNGSSWHTIATLPNCEHYKRYYWETPVSNSEECIVRIRDSADPETSDVSDNVFCITTHIVPDVVAMPQEDAEATIVAAGLAVGAATREYSAHVPFGDAISQAPAANTCGPAGMPVNIVVSLGPEASQRPTVKTESVAVIGKNVAMIRGEIIDDGGGICEYRMAYWRSDDVQISYTDWEGYASKGQIFREVIRNLTSGSRYYYWAEARNYAGTSSGWDSGVESFMTKR